MILRAEGATVRPSIMNRYFAQLLLLTLGLAFSALAKAQDQDAPSPAPAAAGGADYRNSLEQETFYLINQYRKSQDLPALHWDGSITKVARGHSREMADGEVDFGHDGFQQRVKLLRGEITGLRGAGENIFKTDDPEQVAQKAVDVNTA